MKVVGRSCLFRGVCFYFYFYYVIDGFKVCSGEEEFEISIFSNRKLSIELGEF